MALLTDPTLIKYVGKHNRLIVRKKWSQYRLNQNMRHLIKRVENKNHLRGQNIKEKMHRNEITEYHNSVKHILKKIEQLYHEKNRPIIIGVTPPTFCGKSAFTELLLTLLSENAAFSSPGQVLTLDQFISPGKVGCNPTISLGPEFIRIRELIENIKQLIEGRTLVVRKNIVGKLDSDWELIQTNSFILIEGLFVLNSEEAGSDGGMYKDLFSLLDIKVFL